MRNECNVKSADVLNQMAETKTIGVLEYVTRVETMSGGQRKEKIKYSQEFERQVAKHFGDRSGQMVILKETEGTHHVVKTNNE